MSGQRRRFTVTAPDWGQDHLSADALVAYVDRELAAGPHQRATRHLAECPECAAQVRAQGQASAVLRSAECPRPPSSLLSMLQSIPHEAELPGPPAGLAVTADGQFVTMQRAERHPVSPRVRSSRIRLGAGAAVSSLALGALALGSPAAVPGPPIQPAPDRGVFDRPLLGGPSGGVDAQLRIDPAPGQDLPAGRMARTPGSFLGPR